MRRRWVRGVTGVSASEKSRSGLNGEFPGEVYLRKFRRCAGWLREGIPGPSEFDMMGRRVAGAVRNASTQRGPGVECGNYLSHAPPGPARIKKGRGAGVPDDFRYQRIQRLHERFVSASEEFPTFSFALISTNDEELRPFLFGDRNVQVFPSSLLRMKPSRMASEWFHSSLEILAWAWIQWHKIHAPEQYESVREDIGSLNILNSDVDWESAMIHVPNWISILTRINLSDFETASHRNFAFFDYRLQRTIVAGLLSETLLIGTDSVDTGFERINSQESEAILVHFDPYISDIASDSHRNKRMMELSAVALDELAVDPIKQFTPPTFALDRSAIWIEEICSQTQLNEIHFGPFLIRYPTSNVFNLSAHYLEKRMKPTDEVEWSRPLSPSEWEELLNLSWKTIKKHAERGLYRTQYVTSKSVRIAIEDLPEPVRSVVR